MNTQIRLPADGKSENPVKITTANNFCKNIIYDSAFPFPPYFKYNIYDRALRLAFFEAVI
jgi:hypothetical protein